MLKQRFVISIQAVQIADEAAEPVVVAVSEQGPIQLGVVMPFNPLSELAPHEQKLLAGHRVLIVVQKPQVGELLPGIAGHLRQQRPLAVDDFVVRERQHEILGEGIHHAERELVLVMLAVDRLVPHVAERVVHPAHVPLHTEAEPAVVHRMRHTAPSRRFLGDRQNAGEIAVQRDVHMLEELDGFKVLAPAVPVGSPLAFFAGVIEVQHRSDRVDPQPVDVIRVDPEPGAGQQKIADLVAAVVEDVGVPIGVISLLRVRMFVKGRPVEPAERVPVGGEVCRHPIDQDPDAGLVAVIDEVHEVVRRAVPAGRGEIAGRLIAPRAVERVFGQRHQLQMGVTHFVSVVDQHVRQFTIVEVLPAVFGPLPGAQMDLVHRDGLFYPIGGFALVQPVLVLPREAREVVDDRGGFRRLFGIEGHGVGLLQDFAAVGANGVLVGVSLGNALDKSVPDAGIARQERILTGCPMIRVAENRDLAGVGGPNSETGAGNSSYLVEVSAECPIHQTVCPVSEGL